MQIKKYNTRRKRKKKSNAHLLTVGITDSLLGNIQNIFIQNLNKIKVLRAVTFKRVPLFSNTDIFQVRDRTDRARSW